MLLSLLLLSNKSSAQASTSGSDFLIYSLVAVGLALLLWVIISLSDNLLKIEAVKHGVDNSDGSIGVFPKLSQMFGAPRPDFVGDESYKKLKKGFDIKLVGKADKKVLHPSISRYAIKPQNFRGIAPIPKVQVAAGDEVSAGDLLFYDKKRPEIKYVAPVSGEIVEITRGAKRSIKEIVILADKEQQYKKITPPDIYKTSREGIVNFMQASGLWPFINQRPFDIIPETQDIPENIFISTFKSGPLAVDLNIALGNKREMFQKGIDVLNTLTVGSVYLGLDGNNGSSSVFTEVRNATKTYFAGPHPCGNVGVQIHHTAPIKNHKVWTLRAQDVATIGSVFLNKKFDASRIIAVSGSEVNQPCHVATFIGANVGEVLKGNIKEGNNRVILGDVLTGTPSSNEDYLSYGSDQITVIPEGDEYEMFGWLLPIKPRPSISKTFPSFLMQDHEYEVDTNTHGEKRAFVVTGQYESVLPMDIYPQHLMKAILANDFERMEGLGINELSEEDIALCEFVCTSKQPLQSILRQGLELVREQS